jgi:predicted DNA-binding transcriptional regulator AlpA
MMSEKELDTRLSTGRTAKKMGVTTRSIDRWRNNPKLNFPSPVIINGRKYWSERELDLWLLSRANAFVGRV